MCGGIDEDVSENDGRKITREMRRNLKCKRVSYAKLTACSCLPPISTAYLCKFFIDKNRIFCILL